MGIFSFENNGFVIEDVKKKEKQQVASRSIDPKLHKIAWHLNIGVGVG